MSVWISPSEAAERLGVKPATLYAYVSRGQLRRRKAQDGRRSEYHAADVASLAVRGRRARPTRASDIIVPTAVTEVTSRGPAYRGSLAVGLAGETTFEQVAAVLWDVPHDEAWIASPRSVAAVQAATSHLDDDGSVTEGLLPAVAAMRNADPLRGDLRRPVVVATARDLIASLVPGHTGDGGIAARLTASIAGSAPPRAVRVVDAALVLLADHELAASTLAARVAASARCDPYAVAIAGLAVLSGRRHGAASRPLELALADIVGGADPAAALEQQMQGGTVVPGFGLPLYPDGDPRARRLLELLRAGGLLPAGGPLDAVLEVARQRGLPPPNVDLALAGLTHAIGGAPGSGELIFSIARMAGWFAHALEQYAEPTLLRPTAVYTGVPASGVAGDAGG